MSFTKAQWGTFATRPAYFVDEDGEIIPKREIIGLLKELMGQFVAVEKETIRKDFPNILRTMTREDTQGFKVAFGRQFGWDKSFSGRGFRQARDMGDMMSANLGGLLPALLQQSRILNLINEGLTDKQIRDDYGFYVADHTIKQLRRTRQVTLPRAPRQIPLSQCDLRRFKAELDGDTYFVLLPFWAGRTVRAVFVVPEYLRSVVGLRFARPTVVQQDNGNLIWNISWTDDKAVEIRPCAGILGVDMGTVKPVSVTIHHGKYATGEVKMPRNLVMLDNKVKDFLARKKRLKQLESVTTDGHKVARQRQERRRLSRAITRVKKERARVAAQWIVDLAITNDCLISLEQLRWAPSSHWDRAQLREEIMWRASRDGVEVVEVDARNTSQTCCYCGADVKHNKKTRIATCTKCKARMDRDELASRNVAARGYKKVKNRLTTVEKPTFELHRNYLKTTKSAPRSGVLRPSRRRAATRRELRCLEIRGGNQPKSLNNTNSAPDDTIRHEV